MSLCLVGSDAYGDDALEQIFFSLEQFLSLSGTAFSRVNSRLDTFKRRVERVQCDTQRVATKLNAIKTLNKPLVVCAPSKFCRSTDDHLEPVFWKEISIDRTNESPKEYKRYNDNPWQRDLRTILNEKNSFFHRPRKRKGDSKSRVIPDNIRFVTDLLLFNTTVNVYTDKKVVDPFENTRMEIRQTTEGEVMTPAEDVSTLSVNVTKKDDPLFYTPEATSMQDFSFPDTLQKLPAPASFPSDLILPVVDATPVDLTLDSATAARNMEIVIPLNVKVFADDLAIKNNAEVPTVKKDEGSIDIGSDFKKAPPHANSGGNDLEFVNVTISSAPPPPPPPPPLLTPLTTNISPSAKTSKLEASGDSRANLMEAIRRAGGTKGAKLRPVRKRGEVMAEEVSALPKRSNVPSGGDLMSSLAKALETRRKGMAGKTIQKKEISNRGALNEGAFAGMSARIPPPPPKDDEDEEKNSKDDEYEWTE